MFQMKAISVTLSISLLLFQFACTMSDNQNCTSENLLNYASQGELGKIDACYKSGANILVSDSAGKSIRLIALNNEQYELAKYLVDVQTKEWQKRKSPLDTISLWEAIEYDNVTIVLHYIEEGFYMKPKIKDGLAPIVQAVFNNSNEVAKLLLENGVDVNFSFDSRPIITMAAMFGQLETVQLLLEYGANVNDIDGSGVSSLMFAARDGNVEMVKFLLEKGANKSLREIKYQTAADMVKDNEELKKLLAL
jgi:ankyrin repeat protein